MTVVENEKNELIPTLTVMGWRVCIDYKRLNKVTCKDHFQLPLIDQMLDRLAGYEYYFFLDGYSGYNHIIICPEDQEKTIFTCPCGTVAFKRMLFGLCNAPATFPRIWARCWHVVNKFGAKLGKCHLMVQEGIVLGHRVSKSGIEVEKAKAIGQLQRFYSLGSVGQHSSWMPIHMLRTFDYVSKWVDVITFPTKDAKVVATFVKKNIFSRFGTPHALISDEGTHFCNRLLNNLLAKYGVHHRVFTTYHLQTSGQVEVSNREIKQILEKTMSVNRKDWAGKLDDALWASITAYKTPIGASPYKLVYGKVHWAIKKLNMDFEAAGEKSLL
uniref:Integrase catalytic domain-containing protein n=1 Tax=Nicotiana tabacum TaxID=4097 RepID=A0A1S3YGA7_TOBAC|nr:PREDICTED: uncharacterized protein LOC107775957 [Nicotiana tabacum]